MYLARPAHGSVPVAIAACGYVPELTRYVPNVRQSSAGGAVFTKRVHKSLTHANRYRIWLFNRAKVPTYVYLQWEWLQTRRLRERGGWRSRLSRTRSICCSYRTWDSYNLSIWIIEVQLLVSASAMSSLKIRTFGALAWRALWHSRKRGRRMSRTAETTWSQRRFLLSGRSSPSKARRLTGGRSPSQVSGPHSSSYDADFIEYCLSLRCLISLL